MNKYTVKTDISAVSLVESLNEEIAQKGFKSLLEDIVESLEKRHPSIKFKINYFINVIELPKE